MVLKFQFPASVLADLRGHHKGGGDPGINNKQEQNWRGHWGTYQYISGKTFWTKTLPLDWNSPVFSSAPGCWCCCFYSYPHLSTILFILILFLHSCTDTYSPDLLLGKTMKHGRWRRFLFSLKDKKWTDIVQCFEKLMASACSQSTWHSHHSK